MTIPRVLNKTLFAIKNAEIIFILKLISVDILFSQIVSIK